ncbi:putative ABC transporter ATP-binding protein [Crateriforma conspicua]|nr:putative ABC transporter ATP-binding protein [Crateriforma conspicua]
MDAGTKLRNTIGHDARPATLSGPNLRICGSIVTAFVFGPIPVDHSRIDRVSIPIDGRRYTVDQATCPSTAQQPGRFRIGGPINRSALMPSDPNETVYDIRGLTKIYPMGEVEVHALRGVNLRIPESEFVVLLGPSGSGKSTLLNIMGGLDVPTDGEVRYRDLDMTRADANRLTWFRRESVGFVFQFYNLIPSLTARENVSLVTDIATDPMTAEEALDIVGLSDRLDHFPSQLSGGQQQRVAIARAIAKRPDVLLCDEPTGALDAHTGITVLEAISNINAELGTTTAVITHNAAIGQIADRIVSMRDGVIVDETRNSTKAPVSSMSW